MGRNYQKTIKLFYIMLFVSVFMLIALMVSMLFIMGSKANKHLIAASSFSIFLVLIMFFISFYFFNQHKKEKKRLIKEKEKEDEHFLSEVEYKVATMKTNVLVLRYDIKTSILYVRINSITSYEPRVVTDIPESAISSGLISKNSTEAFRNFFQKMKDGIENGECIVELKNVETNEYMVRTLHYTLVKDEKGKPAYGIIDVNKEENDVNIDYYSVNESFSNIDENKKIFLEYDITSGKQLKKEGKLETSLNADSTVQYTEYIENFGNTFVHEEDRKKFIESLKRDKMITAYYDKKPVFGLDYRENIGNDVYRWRHIDIQTYGIRNSSNVCLCLFIIDIDEMKKEEINIKKQVEEDSLTQLYNRLTFTKMVNNVLKENKDGVYAIMDTYTIKPIDTKILFNTMKEIIGEKK